MGYGRTYKTPEQLASTGNYRECLGNACGEMVYWRDGEYCYSHRDTPERRCLDCGLTSRPGILDYMDAEAAAWEQVAETDGYRPLWQPKPSKLGVRALESKHVVVADGWCGHCESTNLAPLTFGVDRLPEAQRTCSAWPTLANNGGSGTLPNAQLNKSINDPGITWKTCASCGERLYRRFKAGASEKWRKAEDGYWGATRMPRLDLPNGKWADAGEAFQVHYECPDPALIAVPYEVERSWDHVVETRYRAAYLPEPVAA